MSKEFCCYKAQSKQILDVIGVQLAPNMTVVLFVHALQLSKMS
jgi:hypothetical protein